MTKRVCPLSKSAATLGRSRLLTHKEKKSEKKIPFFGNCRIFFLSSSQKLWPNPILRKGKYILCGGEDKQRGKRGKIFREEIYFFAEEKILKGKRKKMFVEANYFCERDKNGEGIGGNSRKKLLPKRDDEQKNQQTNKER